MQHSPLTVSVIIPCYNHARYLPVALASVVAQEFTDWEAIIINDGSPDDTATVAAQIIATHPQRRIQLLQQPNRGLAASRNAGIAASYGRYVLPLDADDELEPGCLTRLVAVLDTQPRVGFVYSDVRMFGAEERVWSGGAYARERLLYDNIMITSTLFRRSAWAASTGFCTTLRPAAYEDWDFWLTLAAAGWDGVHVPEPLVRYRRAGGSMLSTTRRHDLELRAQLILRHVTLYPVPLVRWARRWYAPENLDNGLFRSRAIQLRAFFDYAASLVRVAPKQLPKTLARPLFIRLSPQLQAPARRLADVLRMTAARDTETRRQGDTETRRQGEAETRRHGDKQTRSRSDSEANNTE